MPKPDNAAHVPGAKPPAPAMTRHKIVGGNAAPAFVGPPRYRSEASGSRVGGNKARGVK